MAQEAFSSSLKKMAFLDTVEIMDKAAEAIGQCIEMGYLCANVGPFTDLLVVEKAALELQDLGYKTHTINMGQIHKDGINMQASGIHINWKYMPDNTRENYV